MMISAEASPTSDRHIQLPSDSKTTEEAPNSCWETVLGLFRQIPVQGEARRVGSRVRYIVRAKARRGSECAGRIVSVAV